MPATHIDVEDLRGILRYVNAGTMMSVRERTLFDALTRAVALLADGLAPSVTTWILGAIRESGHWNVNKTHWFIDDEDLYNWALRQITEQHQ